MNLQQPWREARFVAVDLETTGTDTQNDRIIELGLVTFDNGEVVDRWQQLINPTIPLPEASSQVTGIKQEDLDGQPVLAAVLDELQRRLSGHVLLAYNCEFDLGVLKSEFERHGREFPIPPCLDPLPFVFEHLRIAGLTRDAKLGTAAEYLKIPLDNAHRADHDAEAAGRVLFELPSVTTLPDSLADLLQVQAVLLKKMNDVFAQFRRRRDPGASARTSELGSTEVVIELGAAYIYGDETDPIRALYQRVPDARDRQ